jgi:hypothetical protein
MAHVETASINLPRDMLEAAIEKQVSIAISTALGGSDELVRKAITTCLGVKVDRQGNISKYSSDNEWSFLEYCTTGALHSAIKKILDEELSKYREQIRKCLVSELNKKDSKLIKQLAECMVKGALESVDTKNWKWSLEIK